MSMLRGSVGYNQRINAIKSNTAGFDLFQNTDKTSFRFNPEMAGSGRSGGRVSVALNRDTASG